MNSSSNPADHASRGLKTCEKAKLQQWLEGPELLWQDQKYWPVQPKQLPELPTEHKELKKKTAEVHTILVNDNLDDLLRRYSSWLKLQRSVAWLLRFKQYLQSKVGRQTTIAAESHLTIGELDCTTKEIIKVVQREPFSKELAMLKREAQQPHVLARQMQRFDR